MQQQASSPDAPQGFFSQPRSAYFTGQDTMHGSRQMRQTNQTQFQSPQGPQAPAYTQSVAGMQGQLPNRDLLPYTQNYNGKGKPFLNSSPVKKGAGFVTYYAQKKPQAQVQAQEPLLGQVARASHEDPAIMYATRQQAVFSTPTSPMSKSGIVEGAVHFSAIEAIEQMNNTNSSTGENDQRSNQLPEIDEANQTVSELLSMLSQNSGGKHNPPSGFIDHAYQQEQSSSSCVLPTKIKNCNNVIQLVGESQIYQRAKLLKAPKASEVPFF